MYTYRARFFSFEFIANLLFSADCSLSLFICFRWPFHVILGLITDDIGKNEKAKLADFFYFFHVKIALLFLSRSNLLSQIESIILDERVSPLSIFFKNCHNFIRRNRVTSLACWLDPFRQTYVSFFQRVASVLSFKVFSDNYKN